MFSSCWLFLLFVLTRVFLLIYLWKRDEKHSLRPQTRSGLNCLCLRSLKRQAVCCAPLICRLFSPRILNLSALGLCSLLTGALYTMRVCFLRFPLGRVPKDNVNIFLTFSQRNFPRNTTECNDKFFSNHSVFCSNILCALLHDHSCKINSYAIERPSLRRYFIRQRRVARNSRTGPEDARETSF